MRTVAAPKARLPKKISITEGTVLKASTRLLAANLVSTEIAYVQRTLGATATQEALDAKVIAVRSMPWTSIVVAD
jgi:hypothetical protein